MVQHKINMTEAEKPHVLVVDDDERLRELLERYLTRENCIVITAHDAEDAMQKLKLFSFDVAILDVMMPGEDGISLAKRIRKTYRQLPFIMLTALGEVDDKIQGLEAGADDYLSKPFEPKELMLRLQAILRRTMTDVSSESQQDICLGDYVFDVEREELNNAETGERVSLTETEKRLLSCLAKVPGEVVTREELAGTEDISASDRSIDVQVTRLRRKLEQDPKNPRYLHTIRGQGYVLRPDISSD